MSEYKSDKELYDQFAEAATALIMRQYATSAGRTVMKTAPMQKTSEELDERCRKQIKRNLRKQQMKVVAKMALRYTKRVAMFIVMLFGIVGILFTTVEAVRVPIINFFIEQKDGYLEISGTEGEKKPSEERETTAKNPLDGLLPEGYELVIYEENSVGGSYAKYENATGKYVLYSVSPSTTVLNIDSEEADIEYLTIYAYEAALIVKEDHQLVWINSNSESSHCLEADALTRDQIIELAKNIENSR